jgi:hypothetical protein
LDDESRDGRDYKGLKDTREGANSVFIVPGVLAVLDVPAWLHYRFAER